MIYIVILMSFTAISPSIGYDLTKKSFRYCVYMFQAEIEKNNLVIKQ
jgi:hypothetical protein